MTINKDILTAASKHVGLTEASGRAELKKLLGVDPVLTPWCAAFVNAVLKEVGIKGTGNNLARSFLKWGEKVDIEDMLPGDIIVLPRGNTNWQGHVGIFMGEKDSEKFGLLAGNQRDRVCTQFVFYKSPILGVRRAIIE